MNKKLVCQDCGSDEVQQLQWVYINRDTPPEPGSCEIEDNWCCKCEEHTNLITEEEYKQQEEDNG